jgi:hypothetical protein
VVSVVVVVVVGVGCSGGCRWCVGVGVGVGVSVVVGVVSEVDSVGCRGGRTILLVCVGTTTSDLSQNYVPNPAI